MGGATLTTARRRAETGIAWLRERRRVVSATLVEVEGSAPFQAVHVLVQELTGRRTRYISLKVVRTR